MWLAHELNRGSVGLAILPLYLMATVAIGWLGSRKSVSSNAYLNSSRSLPLWIVVAAYLAANCGALEIVGLSAMAAQYGVQAFHFYWIGAIPAMVFLGLWMMPVYRRSGVTSIPEYLAVRYGPGVRLLNAYVLAITMLLLGGVSLYATAQVLQVILTLSFGRSIVLCAGVVLIYVLLGGIRATIYNEVFQLLVMVAGLLPLAMLSLRSSRPSAMALTGIRRHLWASLPTASQAAPLDRVGVVFGLGIVLSFGYWCTDFVMMQRAFTARTDMEARSVPLLAGFGKLLFSMIVVLPGLAAYRLLPGLGHTRRFDQALPALMKLEYGPVLLGLGLTALVASLMSGLAANVSAFAAIWTEDIYRATIRRNKSDRHYLLVGRASVVAAIALSTSASYLNFLFSDLMEHVQLIFSVLGSPFWAIFLLGMSRRRVTERGAVAGFLVGATVALLHLVAFVQGWIHYGSVMSANFHAAIYAFCSAIGVGLWASRSQPGDATQPSVCLVFHWRTDLQSKGSGFLLFLGLVLLSVCVALNVIWR